MKWMKPQIQAVKAFPAIILINFWQGNAFWRRRERFFLPFEAAIASAFVSCHAVQWSVQLSSHLFPDTFAILFLQVFFEHVFARLMIHFNCFESQWYRPSNKKYEYIINSVHHTKRPTKKETIVCTWTKSTRRLHFNNAYQLVLCIYLFSYHIYSDSSGVLQVWWNLYDSETDYNTFRGSSKRNLGLGILGMLGNFPSIPL